MTPAGLRLLLERAVRAGVAPGAVAAWGLAGAEPQLVTMGRSRLWPRAAPVDPDTWYDLASLTKPLVTATLTLLAARDGALTLDATVGELLPAADGRAVATATIRELLSHSAGLPSWAPLYARVRTPTEAVAAILELTRGPAGTVEYSCPGFLLLGAVLERTLAEPLDTVFARRVLEPLGLAESAGFRPTPERSIAGAASWPSVEQRRCRELGEDPATVPMMVAGLPDDGNARFLGGVAANAGLFGTAAAVHRLASQYVAGASELLDADEIALATAPAAGGSAPGEQVRGLGWQLAISPGCSAGPALAATAFGHTGFTGTSVWVDPERGAVLVLLTNRHHPGHHEVDLHPLRRRYHALAVRELELGRSDRAPSGP